MATTEVARPRARLLLAGSGPADAVVEVVYQSRATRLTRALLALGVGAGLAPVVFFLPPHFLWPLISVATGAYLARRYWIGRYYVLAFEGRCPRCDTALELATGARIRQRHPLECFGCHRSPELVLDAPDG